MDAIGAIVLAGGGSTRLGKPKQLLPFRGQSLLRRIVETAQAAGCEPIIVVTGSEKDAMANELGATTVRLTSNPKWQDGIGTSIQAGMRELLKANANASAVVLLACDQPFVATATINALKAERAETSCSIIASHYAGTLGVPAIFDRSHFKALLELDGEIGAKSIILSRRDEVATIDFPQGAIDIDTAQDYEKWRDESSA